MIGCPNALENARLALEAGVTSLGNVSHYFTYEYPGVELERERTVYSCGDPPPFKGAKPVGAPEPYAKRTVEGDLGMRESAPSLCRENGQDRILRETGLDRESLKTVLDRWTRNHHALAETDAEKTLDRALTEGAVRLSFRRHAGRVEAVSSAGVRAVQHGKNLAGVRTVIGTGGPLLFGPGGRDALRQALRQKEDPPELLLSDQEELLLDRDYVFYAAGLLRELDPEAALAILYGSLEKEPQALSRMASEGIDP